jgi:tetratricopeptide (TPR) repeat protein/Holliday junction resolvase-like predicted endonuclease
MDNFQRGKRFEEFMGIILSKSGYQINNTRIRRSGREIDISAYSKITNMPVIVECKAVDKKITGPDFSKFYGIYEHEYQKQKQKLIGLFFSISGFNSEVLDYYNEKPDEVRDRFKIFGATQIIQLAVEAELITDDTTVKHEASKSWPYDLDETLLIISETSLFRVQLLKRDGIVTHFIVYRAKCEHPTEYEINKLHQGIKRLKKLESFNLFARHQIMITLSNNEDYISIRDIKNETGQSAVTIKNELQYLENRSLVDKKGKDQYRLIRDINTLCEVTKELLTTPLNYQFLLSKYYKQMNNENLANYCLSRRFLQDSTSENNRKALKAFFEISPSTLHHSLFGSNIKYEENYRHREALNAKLDNNFKIIESSFFDELAQHLLKDIYDDNNVIIREHLDPIVGFKVEHKIALANSTIRFFEFNTSSISMLIKASEPIKAGQLVCFDLQDISTPINCAMTMFFLTLEEKAIIEIINIFTRYEKDEKTQDRKNQLAIIANNIGFCYIQLQEWEKAKRWFEKGLELQNDMQLLRDNLELVLKKLSERTELM